MASIPEQHPPTTNYIQAQNRVGLTKDYNRGRGDGLSFG